MSRKLGKRIENSIKILENYLLSSNEKERYSSNKFKTHFGKEFADNFRDLREFYTYSTLFPTFLKQLIPQEFE